MPLLASYAIWNNKGGVGKTTLTFHVATRYAERNPDTTVIVMDMCPQANVSTLLLSPDTVGNCYNEAVIPSARPRFAKTVAGYLQCTVIPGSPDVSPADWLTRASTSGSNISTPNLFVMSGDPNLELLQYQLSSCQKQAGMPGYNPWLHVTQALRRWIDHFCLEFPANDVVVFIDCNPTFTIYTEIALAAVNRLIVPVNADDFSHQAVNALFTLLYGDPHPHPMFAAYSEYTFARKSVEHGSPLPQIFSIVNNRAGQYSNGAANAFAGMAKFVKDAVQTQFQNFPERFWRHDYFFHEGSLDAYFHDMRDFHTVAVVSSHHRLTLSQLAGRCRYDIEGLRVDVKKDRLLPCLEDLDNYVGMLECHNDPWDPPAE